MFSLLSDHIIFLSFYTDHRTYFAWKTTVHYVKLTCLLMDSFIFIMKKSKRSEALYAGLLHKIEELAKA